MRLGYEFTRSPSTITSSTTNVVVRLKVFVATKRAVSDSSNSFSVGGGHWSSSKSVNISHGSSSEWSSANVTEVYNDTINVTPSTSGTINRSFNASLSGINAVPGTASVSGTYVIPQKPDDTPAAPSNVGVTRVNDGRHTVTWTRNATSIAPYTTQLIQRWDSGSGEYKTIASGLSPTATQYTDTSTVPNRRYRYRVRAGNSSGWSSYGVGPYISTTPYSPLDLYATKTAGGDIEVTWRSGHIHALTGFHLSRRENDGSWTFVTSLGSEATSWTHVGPSNVVTHQYRVRAVAALDTPTLESDWMLSNTIQLAAPPNAPTLLAPTTVRDASAPIEFSWRHNPVDTSAQSRYEFSYRVDGGSWNTVTVTSSAQTRTLPGGTFTGGSTVEWRVRTRGDHASYGPWSAIESFPVSERPSATPDEVPGGVLATSRFTGSWSYFDPENTDQSGWQVRLINDSTGNTIRNVTGSGDTSSYAFPDILPDGGAFTFEVRVQDGDGLWSEWAGTSFTVEYPLPPTPTAAGQFVVDEGAMSLAIQNPAPSGEEVATAFNNVYRMVEGQWLLLESGLDANSSFTDYVPYMGGVENLYVVEAVSDIGTSALSPILVLTEESSGCDEWIWMNGGPGWSVRARVRGDVSVGVSRTRQKTLRRYVGRPNPLEYGAEWVEHTVDLSGSLQSLPLNDEESWLAIADLYAPVMFRDMFGRRLYVSVGGVDLGQEIHGYQDLSVSMVQVDSTDTEGQVTALEYAAADVVQWRRDYARALELNDPTLVSTIETFPGWQDWIADTGGFND